MVQIVINILLSGSIYLLIAISFIIIYNSGKFFHIAHAITITLSGYFTFFYFKQLHLDICLAIPLSIISCIILGLMFELFIYKPMRKNKATPLVLLIASLGLFIILQNIISLLWGNETKIIRNGIIKEGNKILGAFITDIQLITIIITVLSFIGILLLLKFTQLGKKIRAISSNEALSNIFGISSNKTILWAFGIGSALAAIVGILVAFDTDMIPTMGFNLLLYGIVAMIIGGVGSTWGLVGGSLLLATAQHLGAYYIDSKWMEAIAYIILILFLILKPLGFSGKRLKKVEI